MFIADYNKPGCLPESEPSEFEEFEDARDYIVDCIQQSIYFFEETDTEKDLLSLQEKVKELTEPFEVSGADGYIYWVDTADE